MNERYVEKDSKTGIIMAIVAIIFGIFTIFIAPFIIQINLNTLLSAIISLIPTDPHLQTAPIFVSIWVNILRGVSVVSGITLIVIALPLKKGEKWAWPAAISCISLPTMYSVLIALPYIVHVGFPPPAGIVLILGLLTFWIMIILKSGSILEKISRLIVLTLLGVTGGQINVLVMHGIKGLVDTGFNLTDESILDPKNFIYGFEVPLNLRNNPRPQGS